VTSSNRKNSHTMVVPNPSERERGKTKKKYDYSEVCSKKMAKEVKSNGQKCTV